MKVLELKHVRFRYKNRGNYIFKDLNLSADSGDIILVKGASGKGKTSLLNIICGIIPRIIDGDLSGEVLLQQRDQSIMNLPEISTYVSIMMQLPDYQLFFPIVEEELAFGAENMKIPPQKIEQKIQEILQYFSIENLRYCETNSLSFGQKKMIILSALFILSPQIFLLDEPFNGLQENQIDKIISRIKNYASEGKTFFIVEHFDRFCGIANKEINLDSYEK